MEHIGDVWDVGIDVKVTKIEEGGFGVIYKLKKNDSENLIVKKTTANLTKDELIYVESRIKEAHFGLNFNKLYEDQNTNIASYYGCCT